MSRIGIEFPFPNPILGSFGISSINDESEKDLAKARHLAGKASITLIKKIVLNLHDVIADSRKVVVFEYEMPRLS